jgi:Ca2+-binding RTX toxin-like protein
LESLESRKLLAVQLPNAEDQYLIELMNRARANPNAEAARFNIDLNEDLTPGTISSTPKQPLAFNPNLQDAAQAQSDWNFANTTLFTFSHSGPNGNMPDDRAKNSGYALPTGDYTREDAGINLYSSLGNLTTQMTNEEKLYFVDTSNADGGRGHRIQMMLDQMKEVGSGMTTGPYNYTDPNSHVTTTYQGFETVVDFGFHDTVPYLTGVAYNDNVIQDNFYTPGEGLGGVNVVAVRASDGKTFSTQTWASGGYTLPLEPGTYNIYGFGGSLGGYVSYGNVVVGSLNVEKDFTPAQVGATPFALQAGTTLLVNGTAGNDTVEVNRVGSRYIVSRTGSSPVSAQIFSASSINSIQVDLSDGDDQFIASSDVQSLYVNGGSGDDTLSGGDGNDTLTGASGLDSIYGGGGDDRINGGTRNDTLVGGDGNDRLYGDVGNDKMYGQAGVDRLFGEDGNDYLSGGSSNDKLYGGDGDDYIQGDGQNDLINGEAGNDTVLGGDGNDQITGGAGTDSLFGNAGNDTFDSLDGVVDSLNGGAGFNTGTMDSIDLKARVS